MTQKIQGKKRWPLLICSLILFASAGTYSLITSQAQSVSDNVVIVDSESTNLSSITNPSSGSITIKSQNPYELYVSDDPSWTPASLNPWHISFSINASANIYALTCAQGIYCRNDGSSHVGRENYTYYGTNNWSSSWTICADLYPEHAGKLTELFTLSVDAPYAYASNGYWKDWVVDASWATGPCIRQDTSGPSKSNFSRDSGRGSRLVTNRTMGTWGTAPNGSAPAPTDPGPPTTNGPGGGNNGEGPGDGGSGESPQPGTGSGPSPQESGSGGGGFISNSQSPEPNSIPTTTSQGVIQDKPGIVPSPFFDGKNFSPGTIAETSLDAISNPAKSPANFAIVFIVFASVVASVGFFAVKHFKK